MYLTAIPQFFPNHFSDFVLEPVKGFQRSVQEMDASHLVDGVARGTLVRHRKVKSSLLLTPAFVSHTAISLCRSRWLGTLWVGSPIQLPY